MLAIAPKLQATAFRTAWLVITSEERAHAQAVIQRAEVFDVTH
jgi:hypothetical protein